MLTTERAAIQVPRTELARAREMWPETRSMSVGRTLKFALAIALGADRTEALQASRDARIGTSRKPTTA